MSQQLSAEFMKEASAEAKEMLTNALSQLKQTVIPNVAGEPRFFFPNGVELISLTIKVSGVELTFKVAGEKGVAGLAEDAERAGETDDVKAEEHGVG